MSKCIGGIVYDAVGSLATHRPGKTYDSLFEEKIAQLESLQAGIAASVMPKTPPPMPAVKYSDFGIGVDFHKTLLPAMPLGPVPNICMVFDIMGVVFSGINTFLSDPPSPPDIYGRTRSELGEAGFIPFLYQGQCLDQETGLAYNRFRYYSPETGAYISQDPIRLEAGLTNLYAYVYDVNSWVDPWGLNKRIYEKASYHGKVDTAIKSKATVDGQRALDSSVQVKSTSPRRVGIDEINEEFVILDQTLITPDGVEVYHGHVRDWASLHPEQKKALQEAGLVDKKGKIKKHH